MGQTGGAFVKGGCGWTKPPADGRFTKGLHVNGTRRVIDTATLRPTTENRKGQVFGTCLADLRRKHFAKLVELGVVLQGVEKGSQSHGVRTLHADADSQDMYAAIDLLADKLDRLLIKHKEKNLERRNHGALKDQDFEQ